MTRFLFFFIFLICVLNNLDAQNLERAVEFGKNPMVRVLILSTNQPVTISVPPQTILKNHWLNKRFKTDTTFQIISKKESFAIQFKGFSLQIQDSICIIPDSQSISGINGKKYRGAFYIYKNETGIEIVNVLDIEYYLMSVIPAEIGNGRKPNDYQAVMAQAVSARTFTMDKILNNRSKSLRYDLLASTFDQVYEGISSENPSYESILSETRGLVAAYKNELIQSLYHSTCGGQTENSESIWGGKSFDYLRSVYCGDGQQNFCSISPYFKWEKELQISGRETRLKSNLQNRGKIDSLDIFFHSNKIQDFRISKRDSSGRVAEITIRSDKKNLTVKGDYVRWLFADDTGAILPSNWFSFTADKLPNQKISKLHFKGRGFGHGLGMCQWGAIGMSRLGYNYSQILRFYYRGIDLIKVY